MGDLPKASLEVTQAADVVALWLTVDGKRFKVPMGPTYAANLGMKLLAEASKAVNAENDALGLEETPKSAPRRFGQPRRA
jgi:hypothetical protein